MSESRCGGERDRGAVTVEAAISLFALVAVLAFCLAGLAAVADQVRCTDAAREAARLVARGEPERAGEAVERIAPRGAQWETATDQGGVTVVVRSEPIGGVLPGITLRADAYAVLEPGVLARVTAKAAGGIHDD